jgi:hypothetical protein
MKSICVTGVLNPNNQYTIYYVNLNRQSILSFSSPFFLKLNLFRYSFKPFQIQLSEVAITYIILYQSLPSDNQSPENSPNGSAALF